MIWIQVVLIAGIILMLGRFLANPQSTQVRAWKKILGVLFTSAAVIVIAFPQTSNDAAHAVGVGRGADLLLYLLTLAFIFVCINLYVKDKQDKRLIVALTRKVAILEARLNKQGK